jgi:hypothetical protein
VFYDGESFWRKWTRTASFVHVEEIIHSVYNLNHAMVVCTWQAELQRWMDDFE